MERSIDEVLQTATRDYLEALDMTNLPSPDQIKSEILANIRFEFEIENAGKDKRRHWRIPMVLDHESVAMIILKIHKVRRLLWAGNEQDENYDLVVYEEDGEYSGIYTKMASVINDLIRLYRFSSTAQFRSEVIKILLDKAPLCNVTDDPNLIAVNNGIFDYETKMLMPFSPEYVFTAKSKVNYNPLARNPVIHNQEDGTDWDVESWIEDLSDDEGVPELIWQVLGSIVRPYVKWDRVVCLYSEQGNNGKGTLCELMRNLAGEGSHASISFAQFSSEFSLEQLTSISSIIVDENDVNDFTRVAAALKAVITGDYLTINRKFKKPITIKFKGAVVQCLNDLPKFNDKSESLYRRFLLIPFNKCYTGSERKYIKSDYLGRREVLEYVLHKVLHSNCNTLSEPKVCLDLLETYKVNNDPVRQFLDEILEQLVWDLVPYSFMYDMYNAWYTKNNPSGKVSGKQEFTKRVKNILIKSDVWDASLNTAITVQNGMMDAPEHLIAEYNLTGWMNKHHKGYEKDMICLPEKKGSYRGFKRR